MNNAVFVWTIKDVIDLFFLSIGLFIFFLGSGFYAASVIKDKLKSK